MEVVNVATLPRRVLSGARCILTTPNGVERLDPDHYRVAATREGCQSVRVYRRGAVWRCSNDRRHDAARPCAHILAVLEVVGAVRLPATVSPRAEAARRDAVEAEAARLLPERLPVLLARMLDAGSAEPQATTRGRPPCNPRALAYQAIMRTVLRRSLRASPEAGPYRPTSRNTLRRFLADSAMTAFLRGLLEWTLAAARPQEDATRPDACNQGTLSFATPTGSLVLAVAWTPTYGLVARLDAAAAPMTASPGAVDNAARFTALVGADLASRNPTAQANEARCAALAHNLARLVVIELERNRQTESARPNLSGKA